MRTGGHRRSSNVEDRRGQSGPRGVNPSFSASGGMFNLLLRLFLTRGGGPIQKLLILAVLVGGFFLFSSTFGQAPGPASQPSPQVSAPIGQAGQTDQTAGRYADASDEEIKDLLLVVLASTEDVWTEIFDQYGLNYEPTTLVLFTDYVQSACGLNSSATGPFYCPGDGKTYMDLGFFRELSRRYGATGDGAIAYVLAHEVGHHVQNQLGISDQYHRYRQRASQQEINRMTVRLELQADYFAGVWAHHAGRSDLFQPEDAEEAIIAALAIGDDRLQMQSQGRVTPENFTHGTSDQRRRWFERGYKYGDIEHGNSFELDYSDLSKRRDGNRVYEMSMQSELKELRLITQGGQNE